MFQSLIRAVFIQLILGFLGTITDMESLKEAYKS
jgi:hypothetical protein